MTSVLTRKTNTNTDRQEQCCLALDTEPSVKGCVPRQAGTAGTHKKALDDQEVDPQEPAERAQLHL